MGLFDMFKSNQPSVEEGDPYTSLNMEQGSNDTPTIDDVYRALEMLEKGETGFVTLSQMNQGLDIEAVQAVGEMGMFLMEALPSEQSPDSGKIFYKDNLDEYSLQNYFHNFFESGKVRGLENFEVKKF